eukprot:gene4483-4725_t
MGAGQALAPVLFVPHGAGPLPLLGDPGHKGLSEYLAQVPASVGDITAILCVTAHWECPTVTVSNAEQHTMMYDYGGFPPEAYSVQYPARGDPRLAARTVQLLGSAGITCQTNSTRGIDHGVFVPLKIMYPRADVPVVPLSLSSTLDPKLHFHIGQALQPLRQEGVLILGSGMGFHNFSWQQSSATCSSPPTSTLPPPYSLPTALQTAASLIGVASEQFDQWLDALCQAADPDEKLVRSSQWERAPYARECHG